MIGLRFGAPPARILCLGAHPDDIEVGAAGLVSLLADDYPESHFVFAIAAGAPVRIDEALASARDLLGDRVEVSTGGMRDGYLPYDHASETKDFFRESAGDTEPDLVIAPHVGDRHQDHRLVAELAHQLFRGPMILEYEIIKLEGDLGHPRVYVPLSEARAGAKLDHLERHFASQHHKIWYRRETIAGLMRIRGVECVAPDGFAEAFHANRLTIG